MVVVRKGIDVGNYQNLIGTGRPILGSTHRTPLMDIRFSHNIETFAANAGILTHAAFPNHIFIFIFIVDFRKAYAARTLHILSTCFPIMNIVFFQSILYYFVSRSGL